MTPAEHYKEAERLLSLATTAVVVTLPPKISEQEAEEFKQRFAREMGKGVKFVAAPDPIQIDMASTLAAAQVHATLALAGSQLRSLGVQDQ